MAASSNPMTCDFTSKPATQAQFEAIAEFTTSLDDVTVERKAQVSYAAKRKFLWMWTYERTADGVLYLTALLDRQLDEPRVHEVTQVSAKRWNHHVVVKSSSTATSAWLRDLIRAAHEFGAG